MGKVNRDRQKIVLDHVHASSVSKALWPIHTRMNTYIMYHKGTQSKPGYRPRHAKIAVPSLSQGKAEKTMTMPGLETSPNPTNSYLVGLVSALRITLSLCVAGLALVLGLLYSWTTLLILPLICATLTLMVMYWLIDAKALVHRSRAYSHSVDECQQQNVNHTQHTDMPSAVPVSAFTSPTAADTQPIQRQQSDNTMSFPTTPVPVTPVIRVLDTIDLSSTNIEHFLDL